MVIGTKTKWGQVMFESMVPSTNLLAPIVNHTFNIDPSKINLNVQYEPIGPNRIVHVVIRSGENASSLTSNANGFLKHPGIQFDNWGGLTESVNYIIETGLPGIVKKKSLETFPIKTPSKAMDLDLWEPSSGLEELLNDVVAGPNYFLVMACIKYAYEVGGIVIESGVVDKHELDALLLKSHTWPFLIEHFDRVPNLEDNLKELRYQIIESLDEADIKAKNYSALNNLLGDITVKYYNYARNLQGRPRFEWERVHLYKGTQLKM